MLGSDDVPAYVGDDDGSQRTGLLGNCEICGAPIDDPSEVGDRLPDDPRLMWCRGACVEQEWQESDEWAKREEEAREIGRREMDIETTEGRAA